MVNFHHHLTSNVYLQNNLLTAVICWINSHLNTAAEALNSIAFLGWKSIEMLKITTLQAVTPGNDDFFITILYLNLPM